MNPTQFTHSVDASRKRHPMIFAATMGLMLSMILLSANSFGQASESHAEEIKEEKTTQGTYLDFLLNLVGTNFNYGSANSSLADFKRATLGGQVGLSFKAGITPSFSLVPELYFMMKGGTLLANNPLTSSKTTLRLYTFELPVLARFHFGKVHVNAGPSIAYNFYGTREIEDSSSDLSYDNSAAAVKHWDAGIQFGGGYTFHTKRKRVALDIRYNYGLTNIATSGEMYNRSLIVAVHFSKPWKVNPLARR